MGLRLSCYGGHCAVLKGRQGDRPSRHRRRRRLSVFDIFSDDHGGHSDDLSVSLVRFGSVTPCGDINLGQHWLSWWLSWWLVAWSHHANVDLSSIGAEKLTFLNLIPHLHLPYAIEWLDECHRTSLLRSQNWFRWWLGVFRQQAIIWANVEQDLCRYTVSLCHNGLKDGSFIRDLN